MKDAYLGADDHELGPVGEAGLLEGLVLVFQGFLGEHEPLPGRQNAGQLVDGLAHQQR